MKKFIAVICAFALLLTSVTVLSMSGAAVFKLGDVNSDDEVTAADARAILRYSADLDNGFDELQLKLGDVDQSGEITAGDARLALRISADLEESVTLIVDDDVPTGSETVSGEQTSGEEHGSETAPADVSVVPSTDPGTAVDPTATEPADPSSSAETTVPAPGTTAQTPETTSAEPGTTAADPGTTAPAPETTSRAPESTTEGPKVELPADIQAFFDGKFAMQGTFSSAGDEDVEMYFSTDGKSLLIKADETVTGMPGELTVIIKDKSTRINKNNKTLYLCSDENKTYCEIDSSLFALMGLDINDISFDFSSLASASSDALSEITTETVDGTEYTVYVFSGQDGATTRMYMQGDELKLIRVLNADGSVGTAMRFDTFEAYPDSDVYNPPKDYKKMNFLKFFESIGLTE